MENIFEKAKTLFAEGNNYHTHLINGYSINMIVESEGACYYGSDYYSHTGSMGDTQTESMVYKKTPGGWEQVSGYRYHSGSNYAYTEQSDDDDCNPYITKKGDKLAVIYIGHDEWGYDYDSPWSSSVTFVTVI